MHVSNVESLRMTFTASISSNSEMNTAAGSFFCVITFSEHKSILPHQNISTSECKRLEKGANEFNIPFCRLTVAVNIMPNRFILFSVCMQKDLVIVSIMSSDNDDKQGNG